MRRITSSFIFIAFIMCLPVFGQATRGNLSGLVKDPSGASLSGANITARHIDTGEEFRTTTDQQGSYVFPSLPLGKFNVTIEAAGFKRVEMQDIVVEVGTPAIASISLEVGQVAESVVVTGDAQAVINTNNPTLTNVINTRQVTSLPLQSRNPLDLVRLQAGIAVTGDNGRGASVGGLRGSATNVTQDGINAMDNFVKTDSFFAISAPSLNSTSEFSVTVGTVGSDAGRGVAQVRMVTKSGTNELHGGIFWQHRNDALNANTFFNNIAGTPREIERENFFGGTVGGPVYLPKRLFGPFGYDGRNRSFWFFSYEGFREPFSITRNRRVLTQEARQGIFRYTGKNGEIEPVRLLEKGNFASLNPVTGAQLNAMPLPNNTLIGDGLNIAGYRYNVSGSSPNDKYVGRFDQQLLDSSRFGSHKLEFVYNHATFLLTPDTFNNLEAPFPGGLNASQASSRTLVTAAIHSTLGSRITNEVRVGHQRAPVGFLRDDPPNVPFFISYSGTGQNQLTGFDNTFMSQARNTTVYQYIDNFSIVSGAHTFRLGTDIQSVTAITFNDAGLVQTINIGSNNANQDGILDAEFGTNLPEGSAGTAIANRGRIVYHDIVGLLARSQKTFNVTSPTSGIVPGATRQRDFKQREVSLYFQDQWRARRNFTFNYGLRWEFQGVPYEANGLAIQPVNGIDGLFGISGPNNLFRPGVLGGSRTTTLDFVNGDTGKKLYKNDWNNFAPFIGIAYSPNFEKGPMRWLFGSEGKSSIRAGYSISYLHDGFTVVSNALGTGTTNPGLIVTPANTTPQGVLTSTGVLLPDPSDLYRIPITDRDNLANNANNGLWTFDPNLRVPYVQQWSLGIEREIGSNTAFEIRYVGNHAIKIYRAIDINEVNIFENGFLNEFLNAQKNLEINGGSSFIQDAAGTVPLPIFDKLFDGLPDNQGWTNSGFINNLTNNNVGALAGVLAFSPTYRTNLRANLAPNFFVANPNAAFARAVTNNSFSSYNSLQMEVRRRMSRGLQLQGNYTFSKAITDSEGSQSTLAPFRTLRDFRLDRHRANFDQTHRFVANFLYDLPFGTGRRWLNSGFSPLRKVVEGWQLGSIITKQTGPPISIFSGRSTYNFFSNADLNPPASNPAHLVGMTFDQFKENIGTYRTPSGVFFFNPELLDITTDPRTGRLTGARFKEGIFDTPAPGTFGNFPRTQINGPGFTQFDFSLMKRTRFKERGEVEFKMTLYNAFNQANFGFGTNNNPNQVVYDDALVNVSRTVGSARIIHFILGINF
jgi:Carboxypeptidase regulatory-like domain